MPRFLVVDDEESVRDDLSALLRDVFAAKVDVAIDRKQAVERLSEAYESDTPYDIIVLDMMVPRVAGEEIDDHFGVRFLEDLFSKYCLLDNRTAVVVYTQYVARKNVLDAIRNCVACIRAGATDYVLKSNPDTGETNLPGLLDCCKQILDSRKAPLEKSSIANWFDRYREELLRRFAGKAIAPMPESLATACHIEGERFGEFIVVSFDSSSEVVQLLLSDPRLWNLELLNLPDVGPIFPPAIPADPAPPYGGRG